MLDCAGGRSGGRHLVYLVGGFVVLAVLGTSITVVCWHDADQAVVHGVIGLTAVRPVCATEIENISY